MPPRMVGVAIRARPLCPCCGSPAYKRVCRSGRVDKPFKYTWTDGTTEVLYDEARPGKVAARIEPTEFVVIARCLRCGVAQYRRDGIVGQLAGLRMLVSNVRRHAPYPPDPMRVETLDVWDVWGKLAPCATVRLVKPGEHGGVTARVVEYRPSWDRWGIGRTEPLLVVNPA